MRLGRVMNCCGPPLNRSRNNHCIRFGVETVNSSFLNSNGEAASAIEESADCEMSISSHSKRRDSSPPVLEIMCNMFKAIQLYLQLGITNDDWTHLRVTKLCVVSDRSSRCAHRLEECPLVIFEQ